MLDSFVALTDSEYRAAHAAFRRAVELHPNQTSFANLICTTQQNVSKLIRQGKLLPRRHVEIVAAATGIAKEELRPDIYPRDTVPHLPGSAAGTGAGGEQSTPARADVAVRTPDPLSGLTA